MNRRQLLQAAAAALAGATVLPYLPGSVPMVTLTVPPIPGHGGYLVPPYMAEEIIEILRANTAGLCRLRQSLETWETVPL